MAISGSIMTSGSVEFRTAINVSFCSKVESEVTKIDTHCNSGNVGEKTMVCNSGEKSTVSKQK